MSRWSGRGVAHVWLGGKVLAGVAEEQKLVVLDLSLLVDANKYSI